MRITFCGAAGTVTGSCYYVETETCRFIVDCGMFQGAKEIRELNRREFLFDPLALDFVLLTHAHADHSGLIPKLWKAGFRKPIYATGATVQLSAIVLPDSGHIQEADMEWRNRKRLRTGDPLEEPLYTSAEALDSLKLFKSIPYNQDFEPCPGVRVRFLDAGHILGSAIVQAWITETKTGKNHTTHLVFSGDLGQSGQPIIQDPAIIEEADYLLVESTYGNRLHEDSAQKVELLRKLIVKSVNSGGNLIVPAFAIGRTQDLLYHIRTLLQSGAIPRIPVYIDSPMAVSATEIYRDNPGCYDAETLKLFNSHESPFEFPSLHFIRTAEESKRLNENARGAIIISASGMCEAGRILHHLKHNLWRPESHILFVGFQAEGTLGRRLLEGAKTVKIMGEAINVQAAIHSIGGFSAHADQAEIMNWLGKFRKKPRNIFIVHGENAAQQELASLIRAQFGIDCLIPKLGARVTLTAGARLKQEPFQLVISNYELDRAITDLEHSVLNLRQIIRQTLHRGFQAGKAHQEAAAAQEMAASQEASPPGGVAAQTSAKLKEIKRLAQEVEKLLKIMR
ncbi:MAG: MBL fold metallo-hydrolase [Firmicutes bacterium]|nr:MBL fold metallo-hydrolase [Bacillota bacterium]